MGLMLLKMTMRDTKKVTFPVHWFLAENPGPDIIAMNIGGFGLVRGHYEQWRKHLKLIHTTIHTSSKHYVF